MITDARVLQDDFVPRDVVHRHDEMSRLSTALNPVVDGDKPQDTFLVGPTGAGKTCIARYSLDELQEELLDVDTHYVDCWQHSKQFRALYKVLEGVGTTYDIHRSTPTDEMLARLDDLDRPYIVVLDEVDQLEDKSLLRQLWGIPQLTMILIANDERDLYDPVDERLQSRLRTTVTIQFDSYTDAQLEAILQDRVKWGLDTDVITGARITDIAVAADGDARDAIAILREAARTATHEAADEITGTHIEDAVPSARSKYQEETLDRLNDHQRAIFDILRAEGQLSPSAIYENYQERVETPKTKRTVRNYLRKLEQYKYVYAEGSGPNRKYGPRNV
jgi:orc1/cdc6 family replication initiation protein